MSETDRVREAYDALPWPAPGVVHAPALPLHWVNAPVSTPALRVGSRILVAGCGTGGEVAAFARGVPGAEVVGVDLSPVSIAAGREAFPGLDLRVADLAGDLSGLGRFDFVSCHAVADYVPDGAALMRSLAGALRPEGVLYLGTNSAHHPGARIRRSFGALGLGTSWTEDGDHRAGLRVAHGLMGDTAQIADLPSRPTGLLAADVFPAFSHGVELDTWRTWAEGAGLHFAGSLAALWALPSVGDGDLPTLFGLDRAGLSAVVEDLQRNAVLQLLFTPTPAPTPPWDARLMDWTPTVHPYLGREHFPPLVGDWMAQRFVAVATPGTPELRLGLSAWMLEFLRRSDGRTAGEIRATMPVEAHDQHLISALFRFWQAGLVGLTR